MYLDRSQSFVCYVCVVSIFYERRKRIQTYRRTSFFQSFLTVFTWEIRLIPFFPFFVALGVTNVAKTDVGKMRSFQSDDVRD